MRLGFLLSFSALISCGQDGDLTHRVSLGSGAIKLGTSPLTVSPLNSESLVEWHSYALAGVPFEEAVQGLLRDRLQNSSLSMTLTETPLSRQLSAGARRFDATFSFQDVPVYGAHVAATLLSDGSPFVLGSLPKAYEMEAIAPSDWPDLQKTEALSRGLFAMPGSDEVVALGPASRCFYPASTGELVPAWRRIVTANGLPYEVLATDRQALAVHPYYLEATGSALIDLNNIDDSQKIRVTLQDLVGDGTLSSSYLTTKVPAPFTRAMEPSETFDYDDGDPRFAEVSAFAHTDDHIRWLLSMGAETYGNLPIQIQMHQVFGTAKSPNNAMFTPPDTDNPGSPFAIEFGDGDGVGLKNLATDRDVPAHESGHYIVYKYLQNLDGESVVVHEALADSFVFLQQENPCLGKSICPVGSPICIQDGKCLRTADNAYAYNDEHWQTWDAHKRGMVLSGLLWDLVKGHEMTAGEVTKLVLKAITFFKSDSGIGDLLTSLRLADRELFRGKDDASLLRYMQARNLCAVTSGGVADGVGECLALVGIEPQSVPEGDAAAKLKAAATGCGVVGGQSTSNLGAILFGMIGLVLPLALGLRSQPQHGVAPISLLKDLTDKSK